MTYCLTAEAFVNADKLAVICKYESSYVTASSCTSSQIKKKEISVNK